MWQNNLYYYLNGFDPKQSTIVHAVKGKSDKIKKQVVDIYANHTVEDNVINFTYNIVLFYPC